MIFDFRTGAQSMVGDRIRLFDVADHNKRALLHESLKVIYSIKRGTELGILTKPTGDKSTSRRSSLR